jgi:hypothetical protein
MVITPDQGYSKMARIIIVIFGLLVGILHFLTGSHYQGSIRLFMNGYLIDILLPALLFLLFIQTLQKQFSWKARRIFSLLSVLLIGFTVEILQFFDIHFLGETYDPLDFLMYILGVGLGLLIDRMILKL